MDKKKSPRCEEKDCKNCELNGYMKQWGDCQTCRDHYRAMVELEKEIREWAK